jgi:DNA-binding CsgD family transcriptional regulator
VATDAVAPLLERERELAALTHVLMEAACGRGRFALIEGRAGLGKTTLLKSAASTAAERGFTCLRARAGELERDFAFGCLRQLLEPVLTKASSAERERLLEGAAALAAPLFTSSGVIPALRTDGAFAVLHGTYWLLNNLAADTAVGLYIDDLHWCDADSLKFLNYLAPRLDGLRLAVFASTRADEALAPDLARLLAAPEVTVVRLEALSVDATATLCARRLGTGVAPEFAVACCEATGGNPFYLEALLREATTRGLTGNRGEAVQVRRLGPAEVARAVRMRLSAAPKAGAALVRAVAVLGDKAAVTEAAQLAGLPPDEAARATDSLIALSILRLTDGLLEFVHPIVREAVYAGIGSHERARFHARAAELLLERGAAEERIAAQISEAEPCGDEQRVDILRRVAAAAFARGASAAAATWLRRALREPAPPASRPRVLLELGSAELRLALPDAAQHLSSAVTAIREPPLLARAVRELANALSMAGDADRAIAALERAIAIVEPEDRELALVLEAELAAKSQQASREARAPAARRLERHKDLRGDTPGERLVLASLAFERARASTSARDAVHHIERGLMKGRLLDEQDSDVVGPFYALVLGLLATDALDLADTCIDRALVTARTRASIPATAFLTAHRGWFTLRRGSVPQAEADARSALALMLDHGIQLGRRFAMALLVAALVESGDFEGAEQELETAGLGVDIPPGLANNGLLEARGLLRLARGSARAALDDFLEFGRRDELWGGANPLASRWRSRACLALAALGDVERARAMAAEDLALARRWGAPTDVGIALRAGGLLESGAASLAPLREAVEVLARSPAKLEHARALVDLGAALRRANRRVDARGALAEGLEAAERCGAGALVARARTELRAAGGRSRATTGTGVRCLTVAERRVAELAAKGHSNPQIAQALFVTRKTVETHLGHIYAKLDIAGRAELGRALAKDAAAAKS